MEKQSISSEIVPHSQAGNVTGRRFGAMESAVWECSHFSTLDKACVKYSGGRWELVRLGNGGLYFRPCVYGRISGLLPMSWPDNYFEGEMTPDAAGLAVSLMVGSQLSFHLKEKGMAWEAVAENFHLLRDFALDHAEAGQIFGFID